VDTFAFVESHFVKKTKKTRDRDPDLVFAELKAVFPSGRGRRWTPSSRKTVRAPPA
jgi:phage-related protein